MQPTIVPLGDSALTVIFGTSIDEETNDTVHSFFNLLQNAEIPEIIDIIPAYASLTIIYNFERIYSDHHCSPYKYMQNKVQTILKDRVAQESNFITDIDIPVCYDESFGTDLSAMAREKQLSISEIVQLHCAATYKVYMIGFLPGFSYMGKVDKKLATPRKAVPDPLISAGSVGIAGEQTGVYPLDSPGGWNIIGRTPVKIFNKDSVSPCLLQAGMKVRFMPISLDEYHQIKNTQ
jgi:inhibitor of KinA